MAVRIHPSSTYKYYTPKLCWFISDGVRDRALMTSQLSILFYYICLSFSCVFSGIQPYNRLRDLHIRHHVYNIESTPIEKRVYWTHQKSYRTYGMLPRCVDYEDIILGSYWPGGSGLAPTLSSFDERMRLHSHTTVYSTFRFWWSVADRSDPNWHLLLPVPCPPHTVASDVAKICHSITSIVDTTTVQSSTLYDDIVTG